MSTTQKPLLSVQQAATKLCITTRHVRQLWQARQLAGVRVGRLVRFDDDDVNAYIARQRVDAVSAPAAPTRVTRPLKVKTATKAVKSGGV